MREHLEVAVHPFAEADALGDLEHRVLAVLDPPLNLDGMPPTTLRAGLARLRREVTLGDVLLSPAPWDTI
jgi:hypothetical protein